MSIDYLGIQTIIFKMKNKAAELEARHIMQGLEEFANFMCFQSMYSDMKILSVETVEQARQREKKASPSAKVIDLQCHNSLPKPSQTHKRALSNSQ